MKDLNNQDLHDSSKDKQLLKREETTIDLPDIYDIPGQKNVKPIENNQDENLTVASDDEEGVGLFEEDEPDTDNFSRNNDADVTPLERELLRQSETNNTQDDQDLKDARLDHLDFEGEKLNEKITQDGKDLDVPGQEDDDANEDIGAEDEENNEYSLSDNK